MSVRKSMVWAFSGQFASAGISFIASVIVARLLSPHEMGVFAIAIASIGIIQIATAFGVGAYVVREVELSPRMLDTAFTVNAIMDLLLAALMMGISFAGGWVFGDDDAGRVLRVLALGPLLGAIGFRPQWMMQREMQFRAAASIGAVAILASAVVTISLALAGFSYMSLAYGALTSSLVGSLGYCLIGRRHVSFRVSLVGARAIVVFGLRVMSINGVALLTARLSEISLGRILGLVSLGLYSRASNIANMVFDNAYGTATRVMFTKLSKDFREKGEIRRPFLLAFQIITGLMWPAQLGLAILSRPVIHLLYGDKWLDAALPLSLLMVGQAITLSFGMNWELFVLRDETARQTRIEISRSILGLVLFVVGCSFGLAGAAGAMAISALIGAVIYFPHMHRLAETTATDLVRIYRRSGLLALAAIAPSLLLMAYSGWSPQTSAALMAAAILLGGCLWAAMIAWLRHPLLDEFLTLTRGLTPKTS